MFRRFASAVITERIALPEGKKLIFAEDSNKPVSFEYDPQNFTYFRCRAITADEANGNGDLFPKAELKKSYQTFIGVGLYKDHDSDSIDKAIGKVLWAEYVEADKDYVECICAVDKQLAPDLARRVESGIATSVSMGCSVREAQCPICDNVAHNPSELCPHMTPGMGVKGRRGQDGNTVYEINRGLQFTELSLVTVPADPTARIFEIFAGLKKKDFSDASIHAAVKACMTGGSSGNAVLDRFAQSVVDYAFRVLALDVPQLAPLPAGDLPVNENFAVPKLPTAQSPLGEESIGKAQLGATEENIMREWRVLMSKSPVAQGKGATLTPEEIANMKAQFDKAPTDDSLKKIVQDAMKAKTAQPSPTPGLEQGDTAAKEQAMGMSPAPGASVGAAAEMRNSFLAVLSEARKHMGRDAGVEKKHDLSEQKMGLDIQYVKGSSLATSFFVAKANGSMYRAVAEEVLPLLIQQAILRDEKGIATPSQIVADLRDKCEDMKSFKAWAKRRRKKNRMAALKASQSDSLPQAPDSKPSSEALNKLKKIFEGKSPEKKDVKPQPVVTESPKTEPKKDLEPKDKDLKPQKDKASAEPTGRKEMKTKADEQKELEKKAAEAAPAAEESKTEATQPEAPKTEEKPAEEKKPEMGEILAAFESLRTYIQSKLEPTTEKTAVKVDSIKAPADGDHGDKAVDAGKGAIKEVGEVKTVTDHSDDVTSMKGTMPKGAAQEESMKKEAIDKNWSMNPKEVEKEASPAKPVQALPSGPVSVNTKEVSSEQVKVSPSGDAGSKVKKYFASIPGKGPGEAPKAMDLKSSQDPEKEMLRRALDEEKAKTAKMEEKDRLQAVADKIYEIVADLKGKNLVKAGKEEIVIDALTSKFASIEQLDGVKTLVAALARQAEVAAEEPQTDEVPEAGKVVPQVFESVSDTEDAISTMSRIWNA